MIYLSVSILIQDMRLLSVTQQQSADDIWSPGEDEFT